MAVDLLVVDGLYWAGIYAVCVDVRLDACFGPPGVMHLEMRRKQIAPASVLT